MPPRLPHREIVDRLLSASAGVVALSALAVSVYQAKIAREQQKMSAWPYVTQANTGGDTTYARLIQNDGLGPALVRSMTVRVGDRPLRTWAQVGRSVLHTDSVGFAKILAGTHGSTSSIRRGMVLLPGSRVELLRVYGPNSSTIRRIVTDTAVSVRVCFCSLYRDCWMSDSREAEPAPVRACPDGPADEFES